MAAKTKKATVNFTSLKSYICLMRAAGSVEARLRPFFQNHKLTMSQFGILEALYHKGPLCQNELAASILKSGGNITMVVDNLIKRSLVKRERSTEDRRYVTIHLTAEGSKLLARIFPEHARDIDLVMSNLTAEEQKQLAALCKKLGLGAAGKEQMACLESGSDNQANQ